MARTAMFIATLLAVGCFAAPGRPGGGVPRDGAGDPGSPGGPGSGPQGGPGPQGDGPPGLQGPPGFGRLQGFTNMIGKSDDRGFGVGGGDPGDVFGERIKRSYEVNPEYAHGGGSYGGYGGYPRQIGAVIPLGGGNSYSKSSASATSSSGSGSGALHG